MDNESSTPPADVNQLIGKSKQDETVEDAPNAFSVYNMAGWSDELKPTVEKRYRRDWPISLDSGEWVMLGNNERWLIPTLESLGRNVFFNTDASGGPKVTLKHLTHAPPRTLLAKVMAAVEQSEETDDKRTFMLSTDDACQIMLCALKVNYQIDDAAVNAIGLFREDHFWPIFSVLCGGKKKESGQELGTPLPVGI